MYSDFHEEEPRDSTYGELIYDNVKRIKEEIYGKGNGNRPSATPRSGSRTSGRNQDS